MRNEEQRTSPSFREDLPLQMNGRRTALATDETLLFDKSHDQIGYSRNVERHMQSLSEKNIERIDLVNQDSMILCSNIDNILTKEDDMRTDNSHIQLKYAKMLEELDHDSQGEYEGESINYQIEA